MAKQPSNERPRFTKAFLESLIKSFEIRGLRAFIPYWLILSGAAGAIVSYFMPVYFWSLPNEEISVVVYTGLLTLNGLILALSWSAFSRIHECISADDFGAYLMDNDFLGDYIVYIGYVHAAQVAAVMASFAGLIVLLYERGLVYNQIAFAFVIMFTIYALKQAMNSVTVMHDLIWQKAIFDRHKAANTKVISIRKESA